MHAATVPYRSARPLNGCPRAASTLSGFAGSSRKRNWNAFNSTFPGTVVNSAGNYVLPAKFGSVVVNQGQLDDLSGRWYGAVYHPDGDQEGWQKKFDEMLKQIGAFNSFYGVAAPTPTPTPVTTPAPTPTPSAAAPSIGSAIIGYAVNAEYAPLYAGSDNRLYFKTGSGYAVYVGPVSQTPRALDAPKPLPVPAPAPAPGQTPGFATPSVAVDQTSALIAQLLAQGATRDQAFQAAMQSLAAQGVPPTPQLQQQVASDVTSQSTTFSPWLLAGGAAVVLVIGIAMARRRK